MQKRIAIFQFVVGTRTGCINRFGLKRGTYVDGELAVELLLWRSGKRC